MATEGGRQGSTDVSGSDSQSGLRCPKSVLPLPVLRERAGVRVFTGHSVRKTLTPTLSRSTEYRERGKCDTTRQTLYERDPSPSTMVVASP